MNDSIIMMQHQQPWHRLPPSPPPPIPVVVCSFVFMLVMIKITTGESGGGGGNENSECKKLRTSVLMIMANDLTFSSQFWGLSG